MTPKEKLQLNKLLADFDGLEYQKPDEGDDMLFNYRMDVIDYSDDWNLLMRVAEKLVKGYPFGHKGFGTQSQYKFNILTGMQDFKKESVFKNCYRFVKLLNQVTP